MSLKTEAFLLVLGGALASCVTIDSGEPMAYARKCTSSPCETSVSTGNFGVFWGPRYYGGGYRVYHH